MNTEEHAPLTLDERLALGTAIAKAWGDLPDGTSDAVAFHALAVHLVDAIDRIVAEREAAAWTRGRDFALRGVRDFALRGVHSGRCGFDMGEGDSCSLPAGHGAQHS
jgi:hypothetical protein